MVLKKKGQTLYENTFKHTSLFFITFAKMVVWQLAFIGVFVVIKITWKAINGF